MKLNWIKTRWTLYVLTFRYRLGIAGSAYWTYGDIAIDDLQLVECFRTTPLKVAPNRAVVEADMGDRVRLEHEYIPLSWEQIDLKAVLTACKVIPKSFIFIISK